MKRKLDFITNSSSTSWIMSIVPAAGAAASWLATSGNTSLAPSGQAYIVSGGHAVLWMQNNGLMNEHFQLTELFWHWYDEPFSQNNISTSLLGIAGEFDSDIRDLALDRDTLENLAIVVEEGGLGTNNTTNNTNQDVNTSTVQQDSQDVDVSDDTSDNELQDHSEEDNEQGTDADNDQNEPNEDSEDTSKTPNADADNDKTDASDDAGVKDTNNNDTTKNPQQGGIDIQHWEDRVNNTIKDNVKNPTGLQGINQTINININDTGEQYTIQFQNGNVHIQQGPPKNNPNIDVSMNQQILNDLLNGKYKTKTDFISLLNPYRWNGGDIQWDNPDVRLNFADKANVSADIKKVLEAFEIKVEQSTIDKLLE